MENLNDASERSYAIDVTKSFIVQAPAGSGKTSLLTMRFLALLANVNSNPEEILAITFTKKAAFEMRQRIITALQMANSPIVPKDKYMQSLYYLAKRVLERDAKLNWELLQNPNRLKVLTIDAFCTSLVKLMPVLSHFGATPDIIDDSFPLYELAVEKLLEELPNKSILAKSIANLLAHLDNNLSLLQELLKKQLAKREQWLSHLVQAKLNENIKEYLEQSLYFLVKDSLMFLHNIAPLEIFKFAELVNHDEIKNDILDEINNSNVEQIYKYWQKLADLVLTSDGSVRKTLTKAQGFLAPSSTNNKDEKQLFKLKKEQGLLFLESLKELNNKEFITLLSEVKLLPQTFYGDNWLIVESLVEILPTLAAYLKLVFKEHGKVDFAEISMAAQTALNDYQGPTKLGLELDYKLNHILIDEFQDTSISQYNLLKQLVYGWEQNDGRTLFLVGDPMQSIYRFRQAEVGLFLKVRDEGIGDIRLESIQLKQNFRQSKEIINWVNNSFSKSFPKEENIALGSITYSRSMTTRDSDQTSYVKEIIFEEQSYKQEAIEVIKIIKDTFSKKSDASIAILVRSRSYLSHILPCLRESNISYQGVEIEGLNQKQIVMDLLTITKALIHLGDKLAWLGLLRTRVIGLKLDDIYKIVNNNPELTIWQNLKLYYDNTDFNKNLSLDAEFRLKLIIPIIKTAIDSIGSMHLAQVVYKLFESLNGILSLTSLESLEDVKAYISLLEDIDDYRDLFKPGYIESKLETLFSSTRGDNKSSIQILTMHKAKGLEFDCVIIPGVGRRKIADKEDIFLWHEFQTKLNDDFLLLAPIKKYGSEPDQIYKYLQNIESKSQRLEDIRLFYVAATRAKHTLYILGHVKDGESLSPTQGSLLSCIWSSLENINFVKTDNIDENHNLGKKEELDTISISNGNVIGFTRLKSDAISSIQSGFPIEESIDSKLLIELDDENINKALGIVVHKMMYYISKIGVDKYLSLSKSFNANIVTNTLTGCGIVNELDLHQKFVSEVINKILHDKFGLWILNQYEISNSEWELSGKVGTKIISAIVDRTFIVDGVRWIIDYKLKYNKDDLPDYIKQLKLYEALIKSIDLKGNKVRATKLGLYYMLDLKWLEISNQTLQTQMLSTP